MKKKDEGMEEEDEGMEEEMMKSKTRINFRKVEGFLSSMCARVCKSKKQRCSSFSILFLHNLTTTTTTVHPQPSFLLLFHPDQLRQDVASLSSGAIDLCVATPPRVHPSEVVDATTATERFGFSDRRHSATVVATEHACSVCVDFYHREIAG
jgi:hypothetical protein